MPVQAHYPPSMPVYGPPGFMQLGKGMPGPVEPYPDGDWEADAEPDPPVQKEVVFSEPGFGLVFSKCTRKHTALDRFPKVIVHAIDTDSAAAGVVGLGDQLIAVDDRPILCVCHRAIAAWGGGGAPLPCPPLIRNRRCAQGPHLSRGGATRAVREHEGVVPSAPQARVPTGSQRRGGDRCPP